MLRTILVALLASLSGCLIVPTFNEESYQEKEISKVYLGETSREAIVELFGQPDTIRENGAIWVYSEIHREAFVWVWTAAVFFYDAQHLVVEFEQDIVSHLELIEKAKGSSSTNLCMEGYNLISSRREDDRAAKEFQSLSDKCALYFYVGSLLLEEISIETVSDANIPGSTYLYLTLESGTYKIVARNIKKKTREKEVRCEPGKLVFVEINRV
jgi:hypothetical protein